MDQGLIFLISRKMNYFNSTFQSFAGVRLYQGILNRTIPNYAMLAARDFGDRDSGVASLGANDGINDGLWCQSANSGSGIGVWKLPDGSAVPDDFAAIPLHMTNASGQVGLLRGSGIGAPPYQGMYTCTIPDGNGVTQTLVVWAAGSAAYDGTGANCEVKNYLHDITHMFL